MFDISKIRVVGSIEVDVPLGVFLRIMDCAGAQESKAAEDNGESVPASAVMTAAKDVGEKDPDSQRDKYERVKHYQGWGEVVAVFRDTDAHPQNYTWEWMTCKEWAGMIESLAGRGLHGIAHVIGDMAGRGIVSHSERYNAYRQCQENIYKLPVPAVQNVPVEEAAAPAINPLAQRIKDKREESGLSLREVEELIDYPRSVIAGWENGTLTPSPEAIYSLKGIFGGSTFEGIGGIG